MRDKKNIDGFILMEVLLSLTILGIVLVVCIQTISSLVKTNTASYNINLAAMFGQQILSGIDQNEFELGKNLGGFDNENQDFRWELSKSKINDYKAGYNYFVIWNEQGKEKRMEFTTEAVEL